MRILRLGEGKSLSLRNEGDLELFFIGTGSAFAALHYQTNFLIIKGDTHIMVDFGMTGPAALLNTARLKPTDIGVILPTHSHADHVGGIECLALMNRYVGRPFMKKGMLAAIITEEYQRVLWDSTLRGGMEANENKGEKGLTFGDFFNVVRPEWKTHQPREVYQIEFGGVGEIKLEMFRTRHFPDSARSWQASFISYGLYIDNAACRVFISGDTQFDRDLIEMYAGKSDVIFHDVQFFPGAVHAPLADLKTLPADVKEKMYLMHYADNWEAQEISDFAGWTEQGVRYIF